MGRDQDLHQRPLTEEVDDRRFELFELAVEMADRVSARRATANTLFVTLHTALIAAIGLVRPRRLEDAGAPAVARRLVEDNFGLVLASALGIVLALTWLLLLKSYRDLNAAKFKVIHELEQDLPVPIFKREWELLKEDPIKPLRKRAMQSSGSSSRRCLSRSLRSTSWRSSGSRDDLPRRAGRAHQGRGA